MHILQEHGIWSSVFSRQTGDQKLMMVAPQRATAANFLSKVPSKEGQEMGKCA